ncbi:MAG: hypothetical protein DWQ05_01975 [Calditrichaeota bacterium]|nr:MAG: hypothetical protein DWQ05_01975 [Calditrichota bacterium]
MRYFIFIPYVLWGFLKYFILKKTGGVYAVRQKCGIAGFKAKFSLGFPTPVRLDCINHPNLFLAQFYFIYFIVYSE